MRRRGHRHRRRPQDLGCHHVEQGRLAQRFAGLGGEEVVGPGDQVVQIRHDRVLHIGHTQPQVGEEERIERISLPVGDLLEGLGASLVDRLEEEIDLLSQDLGAGQIVEGLGDPEALRDGIGALASGVEDVMEPRPGVLELLVLAEQLGDVQGYVVEELPVVDGEAGSPIEVEELAVGAGDVVVVPPDHPCWRIVAAKAEDVAPRRVDLIRILLQVRVVQEVEPAARQLVPEQPGERVVKDVEPVAHLVRCARR